MVLVDTSVWIDHLHRSDGELMALLLADEVATHPLVIEELALGTLARRQETLMLLERLASFPVVSHEELLVTVDAHRLWGRGLSPVDAHLLSSTRLVAGGRLWSRDKRLAHAAEELGVVHQS